jgi:hypothetical protein
MSEVFFNWYSGGGGGGVQSGPVGTVATNRLIVPVPGDYDDGEIGGMIGRGNRSTRRKPAAVPLCPPQTPHAVRTRTRTAAVGSQRLTASATARPSLRGCTNVTSSANKKFTSAHLNRQFVVISICGRGADPIRNSFLNPDFGQILSTAFT